MISKRLLLSLSNYRYYASHSKSRINSIKKFLWVEWFLVKRLILLGARTQKIVVGLECESIKKGLYFQPTIVDGMPPWLLQSDPLTTKVDILSYHHLIDEKHIDDFVATNKIYNILDFKFQNLIDFGNTIFPSSSFIKDLNHSKNKVAVYIHLYYPDLWPDIFQHIQQIDEDFDVIITVPDFTCIDDLMEIRKSLKSVFIYKTPNIGRDVYPFLNLFQMGVFESYELVCKLHTKKSKHSEVGGKWFDTTLRSLLGSKQNIGEIIHEFRSDSCIGIAGPESYLLRDNSLNNQTLNSKYIVRLLNDFAIPHDHFSGNYFAGTMFWFRPLALSCLHKVELNQSLFPFEMFQTDGTIMHAMERMFITWVNYSNFKHICVRVPK